MNTALSRSVWVNWKYETRNGKKTKVPYTPGTNYMAKSNDPKTWRDFKTAAEHINEYDGIGLMLDGDICGIDIDGIKDRTEPNPNESEILKLFEGTYAERSPSGAGVHILFKVDKSKLPLKKAHNGSYELTESGFQILDGYKMKNPALELECYIGGVTARYLTFTGKALGECADLADKTNELLQFLDLYMVDKASKTKAIKSDATTSVAFDSEKINERLNIARKADKNGIFKSLFDLGDISKYNDDESAADMALCNILAFYLNGDSQAIDQAFCQSKLYRKKWDRKDYKQRTINEAIQSKNGVFYEEKKTKKTPQGGYPGADLPEWLIKNTDTNGNFTGYSIHEIIYANAFVDKHGVRCCNDNFYNERGLIPKKKIKSIIQKDISQYFSKGIPSKVNNLYECIENVAYIEAPVPDPYKVYCENGSILFDDQGNFDFIPDDDTFTFNRINAAYDPKNSEPSEWLDFLDSLLIAEDIRTLQEYLGYCLIPTTAAQTALFVIGQGGEGKSRIGVIMQEIFQKAMLSDRLHRLEDDRFLLARLENKLVFYDDDLNTKKLTETGTFKGLVTNELVIQAEAKGRDKYDLQPYARFFSCGNQALSSCFDRSDGFYRRLLILACKPKTRASDDRFFVQKLKNEKDAIFNWMLLGLSRLIKNGFNFTISKQAAEELENLKTENNNIILFLQDDSYLDYTPNATATTKLLYDAYLMWCDVNAHDPLSQRTFTTYISDNQSKLFISQDKHIKTNTGDARGYRGIQLTVNAEENLIKYYYIKKH